MSITELTNLLHGATDDQKFWEQVKRLANKNLKRHLLAKWENYNVNNAPRCPHCKAKAESYARHQAVQDANTTCQD